jgi:hypothetical protein
VRAGGGLGVWPGASISRGVAGGRRLERLHRSSKKEQRTHPSKRRHPQTSAMRSLPSLALLALGAGLGADARRGVEGGRLGFLQQQPAHLLQQRQRLGRREQQHQQQGARIISSGRRGGTGAGGSSSRWARRIDGSGGLQQLRMSAAVEGEDRLSLGAPRYRPLSVRCGAQFVSAHTHTLFVECLHLRSLGMAIHCEPLRSIGR